METKIQHLLAKKLSQQYYKVNLYRLQDFFAGGIEVHQGSASKKARRVATAGRGGSTRAPVKFSKNFKESKSYNC